jgi:NADP-dependent 3-hydroxy acid dehydrogenase YdfG
MAALDGKTAIVTGASSGIGEATARLLAREGASVAVGARRVERLEQLGDRFVARALDVTHPWSSKRFVEDVVRELGRIDILVNAAGLALGREPFSESKEEDEHTVLETNVHGLMRMTRLVLPHLNDFATIVNIGSIAGRQAYPNAAVYVASKFAVRGFSYALREDLLGQPVRVTTVDPGLVETEFSIVRFRGDAERAKRLYEGLRPVTPEDVADCVLFAVTRPPNIDVDEIVIKALVQTSGGRILKPEEADRVT